MSEYLIQSETLEGIADAIRAKKGITDLIPVPNLANEISSIEAGGSSDRYFDIEGIIITSTTKLVLEQIPSNVKDIIIILETRSDTSEGGTGKLSQIGFRFTRTENLETGGIRYVAYRQENTSVVAGNATYDVDNHVLTISNSYIATNLQYRYFIKLF